MMAVKRGLRGLPSDQLPPLKETLKTDNTEAIKADTEALSKAFYSLSEKLYAAQGGAQGSAQDDSGNAGSTGDGNQTYYDTDYSVHDDDKK